MSLPMTGQVVTVHCTIESERGPALTISNGTLDLGLDGKTKKFRIPKKDCRGWSRSAGQVQMPLDLAKAMGLA